MKKRKRQNPRTERKQQRIKIFKVHYVQEYLRGYRAEKILDAISRKYIVAEQTVRDYIKPIRLRHDIEKGLYKLDPNYNSIINDNENAANS